MVFSCICAQIYLIIVAEISIVQTYLQLCEEDYRWQWRSFKDGASPAVFLFLLSLVVKVFFSRTSATFSELLAQLISMLLICLTIGLISATIAFTVTLRFNQFLY